MNKNKSRSEFLLDNFRKESDTVFDPIVKANNFYENVVNMGPKVAD